MPSLCSSVPTLKPGKVRSTMKAVNFSPSTLAKIDEEIGEGGVGDPHLLAVEQVVLAVGGEHGLGAGIHGVRAGTALRQRVGADPLAGGQLGQIFLLLRRGAEPDDRQRADADVRAEGHGEGTLLGDAVGDDGRGHLVHLRAAVLFRNIDTRQSKLRGFVQQLAAEGEILVLDAVGVGHNLLAWRSLRRSAR